MTDEYSIRYVAFIDILGFRSLLGRLDKDPALLAHVREVLRTAHTPPSTYDKFFKGADFKSSTISDAIALSSAITQGGIQHLLNIIEHLARELLELGYFVRGAIVKDRLFHDDKMVLGTGLVRAYSLESSVAKYPRVIVTREVIADLEWATDSGNDISLSFVRRSKDGPHFQHTLRFLELVKKSTDKEREQTLVWINRAGAKIQLRLDEAIDEPAHYEKVHWFAEYFNDVFRGVEGVKLVEAPGL